MDHATALSLLINVAGFVLGVPAGGLLTYAWMRRTFTLTRKDRTP